MEKHVDVYTAVLSENLYLKIAASLSFLFY